MNTYKIYAKNNYIVVVDNTREEYYYGKVNEVFIDKNNLNNTSYRIFNVRDLEAGLLLNLTQIKKEDGSAYSEAEFDAFYTSLLFTTTTSAGQNGEKVYRLISKATTNRQVVISEGANLLSIVAIGLTGDVRYLKLYNKASAPVLATDVPKMTIPIPSNTQGAGLAISYTKGIDFDLGISMAITAGITDTNETAIGENDVVINLTYSV